MLTDRSIKTCHLSLKIDCRVVIKIKSLPFDYHRMNVTKHGQA